MSDQLCAVCGQYLAYLRCPGEHVDELATLRADLARVKAERDGFEDGLTIANNAAERRGRERDAARAQVRELLDAVESSRLKAEMYERDWYEAKSEFGSAMAGMSARIRNAEQALATAEAERLTLARALLESAPAALDGDPDAYFERRDAANDLAARIVAEADAASKEVRRG